MVIRASMLALLVLGLSGPAATAAGRIGPNFIPWEQAARIARETGKPVACYSVVDSNGGKC